MSGKKKEKSKKKRKNIKSGQNETCSVMKNFEKRNKNEKRAYVCRIGRKKKKYVAVNQSYEVRCKKHNTRNKSRAHERCFQSCCKRVYAFLKNEQTNGFYVKLFIVLRKCFSLFFWRKRKNTRRNRKTYVSRLALNVCNGIETLNNVKVDHTLTLHPQPHNLPFVLRYLAPFQKKNVCFDIGWNYIYIFTQIVRHQWRRRRRWFVSV